MIEMNNINQIQLTRQIDFRFNFLIKARFKWIIIHFKTQFLMTSIKMPNMHKLCQSVFLFVRSFPRISKKELKMKERN